MTNETRRFRVCFRVRTDGSCNPTGRRGVGTDGPKRSGLPGAEHVQQRQRAGVGRVLAQLADVASSRRGRGCPAPSTSSRGSGPASARCSLGSPTWPAGRGGRAARCRARPAAAAGRGWPDRRPQVSTRKKTTGPDRAACRRRPGARPARGRGGLGAAGRRGRGCPAPSTPSSGSGSGPARSTAAGAPGRRPRDQTGQPAGAGQVLARLACVAGRPKRSGLPGAGQDLDGLADVAGAGGQPQKPRRRRASSSRCRM